MANEIKKIALVPAFEPDYNLPRLVNELIGASFDVVVVNDGSNREYEMIFERCSPHAHVISYTINRGKGAALKTGLQYIDGHYPKPYVVVTVDADGQHKVPDVCRVCREAVENPGVLILGSRTLKVGVPLKSKLGNAITRKVYRLFSGARIYDTQTGLRAFSDSLLSRLSEIPGERYEYEMNVLMYFAKEKRSMKEIRIETVYLENNESSHFDMYRDSWRIYREIIKFSASSFISFGIDYALYCILLFFSESMIVSNIAARLVSASVNFALNRKIVFRSRAPLVKSILQYALLAIFILACNTTILTFLVNIGINRYAAKILTELVMFMLSWAVQHSFIFKTANEGVGHEDKN